MKKLNSQLSNPDLIMPGMKIKIPSSGVPVKTDHHKAKEMPKAKEHPYVKEKPKDVVQVQDTKPKEKPNEPVPYVPPVPKIEQPVFPQVDVNYYQTNLYQPFTPPPKKEHHEKKITFMKRKIMFMRKRIIKITRTIFIMKIRIISKMKWQRDMIHSFISHIKKRREKIWNIVITQTFLISRKCRMLEGQQ
ncbi:hypothetical protein OE903_01280 [Bacillus sp. B6(2022)]|nr:hypothetical protein [Bacillus sp. B6(2022)]